jgi:hypothetical protein
MLATIDTSTYADAARVLTQANQAAGEIAEALFGALADAAESTGTTAGAASWASSYSSAAATVADELSSWVEALGNAALLLDASGHNHARAEAAAAPYGLPAYALPRRALCMVRLTGVPPVCGGNTDEPLGWGMIVAHLGGHTWPGADLGRLAALAAAWRVAATGLRQLADLPDRAAGLLAAMTSPELPAATAACTRLASIALALADDCDALGDSVVRFSAEVQHQRDPVRDIFIDLAVTLGLCEVGGGFASAVTGPLGEWAANTYAATRIARAAARIIALLAALDETLPRLRPLLAGTGATDTRWLRLLSETRPVESDIQASNHVLQSELGAAAKAASPGGAHAALTDEQVIETGWGNARTLARHLRDHGADVGASSKAEYVQAAQDLLRKAKSEGLPMKVDQDGVIRVFDPTTELFASFNKDGTARTIFKPDPPAASYWAKQPGELQ